MSVTRTVSNTLNRALRNNAALFPPSKVAAQPVEHVRAHLVRDIERLADVQGTALTLRELYDVGRRATQNAASTRMHSAQWLHNELPIRLAHRVRELSQLPYGLAEMPSVVSVREMYETSFTQLRSADLPRNPSEEAEFSDLLGTIRKRHDAVVRLIAKGVLELKTHCGKSASDLEIRSFLDRFYMSRIGIRVLISHHLALGQAGKNTQSTTQLQSTPSIDGLASVTACPNRMAGVINTECRPVELIRDCASVARQLSYQHYGDAADVQIRGHTDLSFPYIDSHLRLCLLELLKNSIRATVETHRDLDELPPVRVIIADGVEDVTIKISDEGGGFRRSELGRVWSYLFTTARVPAEDLLRMEERDSRNNSNRPDPIAGFGYGLPLSRLYARYWGGELGLTSMEGYGTDAYLHLSKLGNKKECLST